MCYCPTPKLSPHRRLSISTFSKKLTLYDLEAFWKMGTWGNVLISHLLLVIPMSYLCHYTNWCPYLSQKWAHTHTLVALWEKHTLTPLYLYMEHFCPVVFCGDLNLSMFTDNGRLCSLSKDHFFKLWSDHLLFLPVWAPIQQMLPWNSVILQELKKSYNLNKIYK